MCGIGGVVWGKQDVEREERLLRCIRTLQHRGPDECGIYIDDYVGLAHTRLAIIDPGAGQQPYSSGADVLVFNGEIFNFRELRSRALGTEGLISSNSDTEILYRLLQKEGASALNSLNGQFAFCLYRPQERTLLLARDPFGEKPLYYYFKNGIFAFSSEVKGLAALLNRGFDLAPDSLEEINSYWAHEPGSSVFTDIKSVPPGCVLEFSGGRVHLAYFKAYRRSDNLKAASPEETRELISEAVERRMLSDVPLGVYLSGGLDSSIVSFEVARRSASRLNSYAITFQDERFDESEFQRSVAEHLGTNHRSISVGYNDIADNLESALRFAESPSFRTGFVGLYLLSQKVRDDGIKVILTGEGADEVFLGYDIFWQTYVREQLRAGAPLDDIRRVVERLNQFIVPAVDRSKFVAYSIATAKRSTGDRSLLSSHAERFNLGRTFSQMLMQKRDPSGRADHRWNMYLDEKYSGLGQESELQRCQTFESETLLSGHLLSLQGDRASMAHSVETRAPFLDPGLVSAMYTKKLDAFVNNEHSEKHLLKQAYSDVLPKEIIGRQKFPYRAPDSFAFLRGKGRQMCHDIANGRRGSGSVVDLDKFIKFLDVAMSGDPIKPRDNHTLMMGLTTLIVEKMFSSVANIMASATDRPWLGKRQLSTAFGRIIHASTS